MSNNQINVNKLDQEYEEEIRQNIISNIRYVGNSQFKFKEDYTLSWNGKRYFSNDTFELVEKAMKGESK